MKHVYRVVQADEVLAQLFERIAALLAPPCVAEVSAVRREDSSEQVLQQMYTQLMHSTGSQESFSQK
jgi:hypothetical protein